MTTYEELTRHVRRFHRDQLLQGIATISSVWDGAITNPDGTVSALLPWNLAGLAAVALGEGSPRGAEPTLLDVAFLASLVANIEHPEPIDGWDSALRMVARSLYLQWPFQDRTLEQWARPRALLLETPFPAGYTPRVIVEGWDEDLLGCDLDEFVQTGFVLHASADRNRGTYPGSWDGLEEVETFFPRERFRDIADRLFVQDLTDFRSAWTDRRIAAGKGALYGTSPFITAPFIRGLTLPLPIAPATSLIAQRTGVPGIVYAGLEKWGIAFTNELGYLVEEYVGRQLSLIESSQVHRQVSYRDHGQSFDSADWFLVTPGAVLIVEVKSALPTESIRAGHDDFFLAHTSKLDKAIRQVNRTAAAIRDRRPEFSHIPTDRPVIAFVVTLGDFYLANNTATRSQLQRADVPLGFVGLSKLEHLATLTQNVVEDVLRDASTRFGTDNVIDERALLGDRPYGENAVLESAWTSIPLIGWIDEFTRDKDKGASENTDSPKPSPDTR